MSWQEKVKAHYEARKFQEKIDNLSGLFVYKAGSYSTPHDAIKCNACVQIYEPYWGGKFEAASRVEDIIILVQAVVDTLGVLNDFGMFYAHKGVIYALDVEGYPELNRDVLMENKVLSY